MKQMEQLKGPSPAPRQGSLASTTAVSLKSITASHSFHSHATDALPEEQTSLQHRASSISIRDQINQLHVIHEDKSQTLISRHLLKYHRQNANKWIPKFQITKSRLIATIVFLFICTIFD